ncbi:hypothetical protein FTO70_17260 [Methanosarcina sp. KYL-1]|uniref:hypothetical protein n=1 Tax=Methanosarcina sp. KYL-1 TaxID=2602068 RepID=UPI0021019D1A|nr:hypothetical protein [Methanosarcina sp. KYL-1]MCQ1537382.1 hypothetical protein [Methanosarcina sp. KYL-1]
MPGKKKVYSPEMPRNVRSRTRAPRDRYGINPVRAFHFTWIGNSIENSGESPGQEMPCHLERRVENGVPNPKKFRDRCTAFKPGN